MSKTKTSQIFIKGLLFTLPILLTITLVVWALRSIETFLSQPLQTLVPSPLHFPGMGILAAMVIIYLIGLAIHGRFLGFLFDWLQRLLRKLPLVSAVYHSIKEMIDFVSGEKDQELDRVVLVTLQNNIRLIGFVTRQNANISANSDQSLHAVYLPMSYQMGGYLVYVAEAQLETLNISKQQAMQRILTADIS